MTPPDSSSYQLSEENLSVGDELQRLCSQVQLSWKEEMRLMGWLGLSDGMSVLELGCGPGFVTERLAEYLPTSQITALDCDPLALAYAQERLNNRETHAHQRLRWLQGNAEETHLEDGLFDVVLVRLLLQHVPDPLAVLREAWRVLKPGGKVMVSDIDGEMWGVAQPTFPQLRSLYSKMGSAQAARHGDRLIGRRLWRLVADAGFDQPELHPFAYHSDELGLKAFEWQLDPNRLLTTAKAGHISGNEMAAARIAFDLFYASDEAFVLMLGFIACGVKCASRSPSRR